MKRDLWKLIAVLFLGILLGLAFCFVMRKTCGRTSGHAAPHYKDLTEKFSADLALTPGQKEELRKVLDVKRQKIKSLRKEIRPRFEEIRKETRDEIRQILTPEQMQKFDEWEKKRRRRPKQKPSGQHGRHEALFLSTGLF